MLGYDEIRELKQFAKRVRIRVLEMSSKSGASHIGSNYSMVEILTVLYNKVLLVDPKQPTAPHRDRFVLSKGHACAALYATLAEKGFFSPGELDTFYTNGSRLLGHSSTTVPGVEISTGSLGHGLPIAVGMALALKRDDSRSRVFVLLGDGECDEGSIWESALIASHHRLDNIVAVIDYNKIQSLGHVHEVLELEPLADKWKSFGWYVKEVDGHSINELLRVFGELDAVNGKPKCVIAHTVKGKGVSFMEGKLLWHYRTPRGEEYAAALAQLEAEE